MYADSPYAPASLSGPNAVDFTYDTAGNRLSKALDSLPMQTMKIGLIGKVVSIKQNGMTNTIKHGPDGNRYLSAYDSGKKTFYFPNMEIKIDDQGMTSAVRINAKGYSPVAQIQLRDGDEPEYYYFVKDHLGSPTVALSATGHVQAHNRYDPWGLMTQATGEAKTLTDDDEQFRGYTGHELIAFANMGQWNGRLYDYDLGIFPQADKFIQGKAISALNRYALGQHNNPNKRDPSGWQTIGFGRWRGFPHETFIPSRNLIEFRRLGALISDDDVNLLSSHPTANVELRQEWGKYQIHVDGEKKVTFQPRFDKKKYTNRRAYEAAKNARLREIVDPFLREERARQEALTQQLEALNRRLEASSESSNISSTVTDPGDTVDPNIPHEIPVDDDNDSIHSDLSSQSGD